MDLSRHKKALCGGVATVAAGLALALTLMGFGGEAKASATGDPPGSHSLSATPLSAGKPDASAPENPGVPEGINTRIEEELDIQINELRVRWNGDRWEYSTDGGQSWTDTPPEGVEIGEDGGLTMWRGEGNMEDFDYDAFRREFDDKLDSILDEAKRQMGDYLPEGFEGNASYFNYGDTIARRLEGGVWEFSADDGETWTTQPPAGIEVSEDGTRFRIGGAETPDGEWQEDWEAGWSGFWSGGNDRNQTAGTAII